MSETHSEQIERVEMMAANDDHWDLSGHDVEALQSVLEDRRSLLEALEDVCAIDVNRDSMDNTIERWKRARAAIAKATGTTGDRA